MSLLIAINGAGDNWAVEPWRRRFRERLPELQIWINGIDTFDSEAVQYAATWRPQPGLLAGLKNLRVIFNLGAGVDALLADKTLPNVPVVRVADDDLTGRMTEYVVLHVLMHHRRMPMLMAAQRRGEWLAKDQWSARQVRVGMMGLGVLGLHAAAALLSLGFQVNGWSRSAKAVPGVKCFHGTGGLDAFLGNSDILVALLPLTPETRGILNAGLFNQLPRGGVLGAPILINAGRGGLQVETDILRCLDDGTLGGASLDVFETEPLPATSRLWSHPQVLITPHNAADSDPDSISGYVAQQILAHLAGKALVNVVDRATGY